MREFILIPVEWIYGGLILVAVSGIGLGLFSFFSPSESIGFYVRLMHYFHWKVEPLYPEREVRNTRLLGAVMTVLALAILLVLGFSGPLFAQETERENPQVFFIDTHTHFEMGASEDGSGSRDSTRSVMMAMRMMNMLGIHKILMMPVPSPRAISGGDYQSFLETVNAYPDRFGFLAGGRSLNPLIQQAIQLGEVTPHIRHEFEALAREIVQAGASGFGEMTALHLSFFQGHPFEEAPPDHPLFLLLADLSAKYAKPIDLHMEAVPEEMPLPSRFPSPPNPKTLRANISGLEVLLDHNPKARIVWVHAGWDNTGYGTPELYARLLAAHPNLYFSIKIDQASPGKALDGMSPLDSKGLIRPEWLKLLAAFPDRFIIGTDAFYSMPGQVQMMTQGPRALLAQLAPELARKIGYVNPVEIYNLK